MSAARLAIIETDCRRLTFAAIGNIRAALFGRRVSLFPCDSGIVGAGFRRLLPTAVDWADGDLLVIWSDGLRSGISLDAMPSRLRPHPQSVVDWLADIFATGTDDVGVVCARLSTGVIQ